MLVLVLLIVIIYEFVLVTDGDFRSVNDIFLNNSMRCIILDHLKVSTKSCCIDVIICITNSNIRGICDSDS
jgi:hypothetical protein